MSEWSEVELLLVKDAGRFDADYYKPRDLAVLSKIGKRSGIQLSSLCNVLNGRTPNSYTEDGEFYVVRSGDLSNPLIYPGCSISFLRTTAQPNLVALEANDVLISSIGMGSIGKISLVIEPSQFVTVSEVTILRDSKVPPESLFAYLRTKQGQRLIEREITGATGQQHLLKSKVQCIVVPSFSQSVLKDLKQYCRSAWKHEKLSMQNYSSANQLLSSSLGLDKIKLKATNCFAVHSDRVHSANRLDAEFFQPYFQRIFKILGKKGKTIGDVAMLRKDYFKPRPETKFQYTEISDLRGDGSASSNEVKAEYAPSRATWIVNSGDVITSTVRPIRRLTALIEHDQSGHVCSSGFAVLTPKDVSSELLMTYLRLPIICEIMNLHCSASMYPAISITDLLKIPFSPPDTNTAKEIKKKILLTQRSRRKASFFLKKATSIVEDALSCGDASNASTF